MSIFKRQSKEQNHHKLMKTMNIQMPLFTWLYLKNHKLLKPGTALKITFEIILVTCSLKSTYKIALEVCKSILFLLIFFFFILTSSYTTIEKIITVFYSVIILSGRFSNAIHVQIRSAWNNSMKITTAEWVDR